MQKLIDGNHHDFHFNPFSGVLAEDIPDILVPRFDIESLVKEIENSEHFLMEFVGKHGRGKTTHLKYLHEACPHYPLFLLTKHSPTPSFHTSQGESAVDRQHTPFKFAPSYASVSPSSQNHLYHPLFPQMGSKAGWKKDDQHAV